MRIFRYCIAVLSLLILQGVSQAAVLPDERVDALYHSYDGGDVQVTGPSVLVRKGISTNWSTSFNYYTDYITSASIDVIIGGSPYEEERTEQTLGFDYLRGKTTMNLSYTKSIENDYDADTISFGISQDFFGDLSTITMGYAEGSNLVGQRVSNNPKVFEDRASIDRKNYRVGFSQVITKNATLGFGWETITDEAASLNNSGVTLNNPYRSYSFGIPGTSRSFAQEKYPKTRTSNAASLRANYFLPFKAAIHAEYRWFQDSWGIRSDNYGLSYVHPIGDWILDFRYRYYSQTKADFYRDMFDFADQFDFMARDKELSTYTSTSLGFSASYEFAKNGWGFIDKGSLNFSYDIITFDYKDWRNACESQCAGGTASPGLEPFYSFDAEVIQAFISIWY